MNGSDETYLGDRSVSIAFSLVLLGMLLVRAEVTPVLTLWLSLIGGVALCVWLLVKRAGLPRLALAPVVSLGLAVVWFGLRGVMATSRTVSLLGTVSQHNGAALWLAAWLWLAASVSLGTRWALRSFLAVASVSGALFSVATFIEIVAGGASRTWGSAAGVFDNSSSLGQYLACALLASAAWFFTSQDTGIRLAAGGCGLLSIAGLVASTSRAGFIGALLGLLVAAVVHFASLNRPARVIAAVLAPVFLLGATAVLAGGSLGRLGAPVKTAVGRIGTQRDVIWSAATRAFLRSPWTGRGLEQFSAMISWGFGPGGQLVYNGTYDPHNDVLAVAVGGGVIALVLVSVFAALLLFALLVAHSLAGRPPAFALAIGAAASVVATGMFTWHAPLAVVGASSLAGLVIASVAENTHPSVVWQVGLGAAGVVGLAAVVALAPAVSAEFTWAAARKNPTTAPAVAARLSRRYPDPAFASQALYRIASASGAADTRTGEALARRWVLQRTWHVDLSLSTMLFEQRRSAQDGANTFPEFATASRAGKIADPGSGIWDTLLALEAQRVGETAIARQAARRALARPLGPADRALLEPLAR